MASSNQEGVSQPKPAQLATHYSDTCVVDQASPSPPPPPPPPTTSYGTYSSIKLAFPCHVLGKGSPKGGDLKNTCYTATGYPTVLDDDHSVHAYPQGHAVYTDEFSTGYKATGPSMAPYYGPPPIQRHLSTKDKLLRFSIFLCILVLLAILIASFVLDFEDEAELPIFKVRSMTVANFTINPHLSGKWEIWMDIVNPDEGTVAIFYNFHVSLLYQDDVVAKNNRRYGFKLLMGQTRMEPVRFWSNSTNEEDVEKDDMEKERSSGSITFALKVSSKSMEQDGFLFSEERDLVSNCEELKVVFQSNNATNGALDNGGKPVTCKVNA